MKRQKNYNRLLGDFYKLGRLAYDHELQTERDKLLQKDRENRLDDIDVSLFVILDLDKK